LFSALTPLVIHQINNNPVIDRVIKSPNFFMINILKTKKTANPASRQTITSYHQKEVQEFGINRLLSLFGNKNYRCNNLALSLY
jgi:hypothetical protein